MHEKLSARYGSESIFRDINNIPPAANFRKVIGKALRHADLMLVVIGPRWRGPHEGKHRIDEPGDWVRIEVETALQLDIPIIPVLVEGADMPKAEELPDSLKELVEINAITVESAKDFQTHMARLFHAIDEVLHLTPTPPESARSSPSMPSTSGSPPLSPAAFYAPPSSPTKRVSFLARIILPVRTRYEDSIGVKLGKLILLILYYSFCLGLILGIVNILAEIFNW